MPALNIPEPFQLGVQKLAELPEPILAALAAALKETPPSTSSKVRISSVAPKVSGLSTDDVDLILRTLDSLYQVRAHLEAPLDKFISDVVAALKFTKISQGVSEKNEATLRTRLELLLSATPLAISAKAQVLQREHAYLYHDARIITDLRPVFGASTKDAPEGVVVDHTLKVVYHEGGDHHELYLALDSSDLIELKKIIERAEEKEQALRTLLDNKGIKVF